MAIKRNKFIVGSIRGLVYKVRKNIQIIQSAPGKGGVRQTTATKKSAGIFGKSSALAKSIRKHLGHIIFQRHDDTMVYRLTAAVSSSIRQCYDKETETFNFNTFSFDNLVGFDFNANSPLRKSLWLSVQSEVKEGLLTITIPESQIPSEFKFPKFTNACTIKMGFTLFYLEGGLEYNFSIQQKIEIKMSQGIINKHEFEFQIPNGCLCVAGIVLDYYKMYEDVRVGENSKAFNPSGICAAYFNPGTFIPENPSRWSLKDKAVLK